MKLKHLFGRKNLGFICVLKAYFLSIFSLLLHNTFHWFGSIHSRFQGIHSILEILGIFHFGRVAEQECCSHFWLVSFDILPILRRKKRKQERDVLDSYWIDHITSRFNTYLLMSVITQ